jgi:hypothetical protein
MPEPLIILCPPRSYSSIVCGMIGQHPDCYGLPELNLFVADTLGEAWQGHIGFMGNVGRDGLVRVLAQLHDGEQNPDTVVRAKEWIQQHSDWPVRKVFDHIQELVGERILVEKSPSTVFQREFLDRMLRTFPAANILHLIRHPRGTAESVLSLRANFGGLNRLVGNLSSRDPERVWLATHDMIVAAAEDLALGQCMRLKGEALLGDLDIYLPQICEWLDIRHDAEALEAMMHPERSPYAKPGPSGASGGNDPNFLANPSLDRERLAKLSEPLLPGELSWRPGQQFEAATTKLAKQLGYS